MKTKESYPETGPLALFLGAVANGCVLIGSLRFFRIPKDEFIRPMGWSVIVAMIVIGCYVVALPAAIHALCRGFPRKLAMLAIILAVSPWPLAVGILELAAWLKGFHLSP